MGGRYADVQYYEVKGDGGSLALIKSEITALNSDEAAPRRRKKEMRTNEVSRADDGVRRSRACDQKKGKWTDQVRQAGSEDRCARD